MDEPKVMLLVPLYRAIPSSSVAGLLQLISEIAQDGLLGGVNLQVDLYVATARDKLAAAAVGAYKRGEVTHAFWVDDDMSIPPGGLRQLLSHGEKVVSGLYFTRDLNPCVFDIDPEFSRWTEAPETGLHKVQCTGFGGLLMECDVLENMAEVYDDVAWFQTPHTYDEEHKAALTGEDIFFYRRLMEMGYEAYLDCDVKLGHTIQLVLNEVMVKAVKGLEGITIGDYHR